MFALIARTQQTTMLDGYIEYGAGDFDGQNSGHDFYGVSSRSQKNVRSLLDKNMQNGEELHLATLLEADPCGQPLVLLVTRRRDYH